MPQRLRVGGRRLGILGQLHRAPRLSHGHAIVQNAYPRELFGGVELLDRRLERARRVLLRDLRLVQAPQLTLRLRPNEDLEVALVDVTGPVPVNAITVHALDLLGRHVQVQFPSEDGLRREASPPEVPAVAALHRRARISSWLPLIALLRSARAPYHILLHTTRSTPHPPHHVLYTTCYTPHTRHHMPHTTLTAPLHYVQALGLGPMV